MSAADLIQRAQDAGLELRLEDGKIKVRGKESAVAAMLNPLREHKDELMRWFTSALNDPVAADPMQWHELARAYHDHHFKCRTCIAAGQGVGLRCGIGSALWRAYSLTPPPKNALNPSARSGKEENHE